MSKKTAFVLTLCLLIGIPLTIYNFSYRDKLNNKDCQTNTSQSQTHMLSNFLEYGIKDPAKRMQDDYQTIRTFIENNPDRIDEILKLYEIDKGVFVAFCIEMTMKKNPIPGLNQDMLLIDAIPNPIEYKVYYPNDDEILFILLNGRGARNNGYLVWKIKVGNNYFKASVYKDQSSQCKSDCYEITASEVTYDSYSESLIITNSDAPSKVIKLQDAFIPY